LSGGLKEAGCTMKQAQLIGIGVAGVASIAAFVIMGKYVNKPQQKQVFVEKKLDAVRVLVARSDLPLGSITTEQSFRWQDWPKDAVSPSFITSATKQNADKHYANFIARSPILAGEPITENKVIKSGSGGVLAAILPPGMRAVSTKISEQSAVGKLILPNDHVDVILIQRKRGKAGEDVNADTLFRNVRVLAIGQVLEVKEGKKNAEGNVATLELTPKQTEMLAMANTMGELTLALRSVADLNGEQGPEAGKKAERTGAVRVLRYGVKSRVYGVNQ
jgi:pilus assembly protein CpaB